MFQVTIGSTHPIKANGLKTICEAFSDEMRSKIARKVFMFVIPFDGKLHSLQPLHTVKSKTFDDESRIPVNARDFEQWVYRRRISANCV